MTDIRKIIRVFLASPGDLPEERRAAKVVVDETNYGFANELGYQIELVGWEDTVSVYGRPQAIINAELDRCELFLGLMWKRWGTPPAADGPYTSGFEEEFRRSVDRRRNEGRPEISLLFKDMPPRCLVWVGKLLQAIQPHLTVECMAERRAGALSLVKPEAAEGGGQRPGFTKAKPSRLSSRQADAAVVAACSGPEPAGCQHLAALRCYPRKTAKSHFFRRCSWPHRRSDDR
jgi:hypothetical protein